MEPEAKKQKLDDDVPQNVDMDSKEADNENVEHPTSQVTVDSKDREDGQDKASRNEETSEKQVSELPDKASSREIDVGITEYISKHEGFTAIIKQR